MLWLWFFMECEYNTADAVNGEKLSVILQK